MKKRQRKKLNRYACLTCRSTDGLIQHKQLKSGKWVSEYKFCFKCNSPSKENLEEAEIFWRDWMKQFGEELD